MAKEAFANVIKVINLEVGRVSQIFWVGPLKLCVPLKVEDDKGRVGQRETTTERDLKCHSDLAYYCWL